MKSLLKCQEMITGNLLCFIKLIGIHLSRQKNTNIPQQINFTGKLGEDNGAALFFIAEKQQKTILNYCYCGS